MRTFQDHNFLVWEAFPSSGRHGYSTAPRIIFNCLTQRDIRPRYSELGAAEATVHRTIVEASPAELLELLERAREIP